MKLLFATLLFVISSFLSYKSLSQSGSLDKTFGINGITTTDFYHNNDYGRSMAIQPDEKILLAGNSTDSIIPNYISVCRYNKDGSLDNSFGNTGKVFISSINTVISSIALQSDKKIVLGGNISKIVSEGNINTVFLERLNPNGSIDSSFGLNGTVQYDTVNYNAVLSIKIQKDGKIVTAGAGKSPLYLVSNVFTLHRFNTNGSIDSTFGINGDIYMHLADGNDIANDLVIQNDGKIVAGGFINVYVGNVSYPYITLIRFNTDGSLDNSFGNNGIDTVFINSPYDYGVSLALQTDQKIVASHFSVNDGSYSFALLRFGKNGGLDSSFGDNGLVETSLTGNDYAYSVCLDSLGNIYQTGPAASDIGLVKYKSSGALDSSFGSDGKVTTSILIGNDFAYSVKSQPDSKILVGCYAHNSSDDFGIIRYNNEVILPVSLLNFTAKKQNNTILLQWQTTNEINNNYFDIERSTNSKIFTSIGTKQALNSFSVNNYFFNDNSPLIGTNYYRLKQVDVDGKCSYSAIADVDFINDNCVLVINPNPAFNSIKVSIPKSNSVSEIIIYNSTGKKVLSAQAEVGIVLKELNISNLSSGIYNLVLLQNGRQTKLKFVKE